MAAIDIDYEELKLERDQLKCWATTADEKVKKLELELADYKRISLEQEKTKRELRRENNVLKERVAIMDRCKEIYYQKCQEDPDDNPDKRKSIKWSICLEGGLAYYFHQNVMLSKWNDRAIKETAREKVNNKKYENAIYDIHDYLEDYEAVPPADAPIVKFKEIVSKYNIDEYGEMSPYWSADGTESDDDEEA